VRIHFKVLMAGPRESTFGFAGDYPFHLQDKRTQSYLDAGYKSKYVQGWSDSSSVTCGQKVQLHLRGNDTPVVISLYRLGYYGGTGARLVKKIHYPKGKS
jgi:hypothetical protein